MASFQDIYNKTQKSRPDVSNPDLSSFTSPTTNIPFSAQQGTITFKDLPQTSFGNYKFDNAVIQEIKIDKKRAVVKHMIPYSDQDLLEDLGQHSADISISVVFSNGVDPYAYPGGYKKLLSIKDLAEPDYLIMPDGTSYYCRFTDIQTNYTTKQRDGVVCMCHFVEDTPIVDVSVPQLPTALIPSELSIKPDQLAKISVPTDDQLSDISDINKALNDVTGALALGLIYSEAIQGEIDGVIGKIMNVLTLLDKLDQVYTGEFAQLAVYLNDLLFMFNQKKYSDTTPTSAVIDVYVVNAPTAINPLIRQLNLSLSDFYALNPWHIGKLSLDIEDIVKYKKGQR